MATMLKRGVRLVLTVAMVGTLCACGAQITSQTNASEPQVETAGSQPESWLRPEDLPEGTMCLRELNEAEQNVVDVLCSDTEYGRRAAMFPFHVGEACTSVKLWSETYQDGKLLCKESPMIKELAKSYGEIGVTLNSPEKRMQMCVQQYHSSCSMTEDMVRTGNWDNGHWLDTRARVGEHPIELGVPYNLMAYVDNEEQIGFGTLSTYGEGKEGMENYAYMVLIRCEFNSSLSQNNQLDS